MMDSMVIFRVCAGENWNAKLIRKLLVPVVVASLALMSLSASAGERDLNRVIPGLYGGDGIVLANPMNMHSPIFTNPDGGELQQIGAAIGSGVNLFAAGAVVSSFTFDPSQAVFVRSDEGLGSMIADLADTIGRGNISIGASYTRFDFKNFQGEDLSSLEVDFDHFDLCGQASGAPGRAPSAANNFCNGMQPSFQDPAFEVDSLSVTLDVAIAQEIFAFFANYGVLDNWDVGIVVPVVHSNISVSSHASVVRRFGPPTFAGSRANHNFCTPAQVTTPGTTGCDESSRDLPDDFRAEDAWGIGDVELRSKYQFLNDHAWAPDSAILARVRLPTGDEDDFLGAGFTSFSGALILSKTISIFTPHANLGIELTTGPGSFDNARWVVGSTAKIHDRVTVAADFMGRHTLENDGIGDDILEVGFSVKVNPFSSFNIIGNAILPLNYNTGLRTAVTWGIGFEHTF